MGSFHLTARWLEANEAQSRLLSAMWAMMMAFGLVAAPALVVTWITDWRPNGFLASALGWVGLTTVTAAYAVGLRRAVPPEPNFNAPKIVVAMSIVVGLMLTLVWLVAVAGWLAMGIEMLL